MQFEQVIQLLGKEALSPELESVYDKFGIRRRPYLDSDDIEDYQFYTWLPCRNHGIELTFCDKPYFDNEDEHLWGQGPLILTGVVFYSESDDILAYQDTLPFSLQWNDTQRDVRQKLSNYEESRRSYLRDVWSLPQCELVVSYDESYEKIVDIVCELRKSSELSSTTLELNAIIDALGSTVDHSDVLSAFDGFDIPGDIKALDEGEHSIDYLNYGFEFFLQDELKTPTFGAIKLYRAGDLDAKGWSGQLPFNLQFDDSPEILFQKISLPPDSHQDDVTTGFALWHFETYDLHVLYSTYLNQIQRINIMSKSYW
ncbi:hypothetical protein [Kangiella shandongensis]|uniref:hypothetical protein n=1 Tax=Kangiella shandongensis TaxID=2763258 RepID=UPI001CBC71C6|nr:hypothetical protein [Kangiella shandongensis]